ncbi:MAG: hypothetical protein HY673_22610 [Chloroflexi bacterium]|nr:hypothetical protein [Chloroflexota bacterium]
MSVLTSGDSFSNYVRTGDCLGWETASGPLLLSLMGQLVCVRRPHHNWVWIEKNRIQGAVSIRQRDGRSAWEVNSLLLSAEAEKVGFNLLDALGLVGGALMITRFFLRLPDDSRLMEIVKRSGFSLYARQLLYAGNPGKQPVNAVNENPQRPASGTGTRFIPTRSRRDFRLFQTYNQIIPEQMRLVEGLTYDDWKDSRESVPNETVYYCETEGRIAGWLSVLKRGRRGCLQVFTPPDSRSVLEDSFSFGLSQLASEGEIYCTAFDHQVAFCRLLEDQGFRLHREYCLLARAQVVPIKQAYLVPARL